MNIVQIKKNETANVIEIKTFKKDIDGNICEKYFEMVLREIKYCFKEKKYAPKTKSWKIHTSGTDLENFRRLVEKRGYIIEEKK